MLFHIYISAHRQSSTIPPQRIHHYLRAADGRDGALHRAGQTVAQLATHFGFHRTTAANAVSQTAAITGAKRQHHELPRATVIREPASDRQ